MTESIPWILISIGTLVVLLGIVALVIVKNRKKKIPTDYYTFFVMGLIWMPLGIILENYVFSIMGLIFMAIGLKNKDKWKKNRPDWSKLDKTEKKIMKILIAFLTFTLIAGVVVLLLVKNNMLF